MDVGAFISRLLASVVDGFKVKNPQVFLVIQTILGAVLLMADYLQELTIVTPTGEIIPQLGDSVLAVIDWVEGAVIFLGAVVGSRTTAILKELNEDSGEEAPAA